jgi:hypothetical protein
VRTSLKTNYATPRGGINSFKSKKKVALQCGSKQELFEIRPKRGNRVQIIRENLKKGKEKEN